MRKAVGSSAEDGDSNEGDDDDEEDEAAEDYLLPGANNSFGGAITSGSNGGLERSVAGLRPAAAVGLPSQEELEASLVDQKKKLLLERMLL